MVHRFFSASVWRRRHKLFLSSDTRPPRLFNQVMVTRWQRCWCWRCHVAWTQKMHWTESNPWETTDQQTGSDTNYGRRPTIKKLSRTIENQQYRPHLSSSIPRQIKPTLRAFTLDLTPTPLLHPCLSLSSRCAFCWTSNLTSDSLLILSRVFVDREDSEPQKNQAVSQSFNNASTTAKKDDDWIDKLVLLLHLECCVGGGGTHLL